MSLKRGFWKKKPDWQAQCREVFSKDGYRYFKYIDEDKIPIKRFEQSEIILQEIQNRISTADIQRYIEVQRGFLHSEKTQTERLDAISQHLKMLEDRVQDLCPPELYFKLICNWWIREDEDPAIIDDDIAKEKLKSLSTNTPQDFFLQAGLGDFLPFQDATEKDANKYWQIASQRAEKFRELNQALATKLESTST